MIALKMCCRTIVLLLLVSSAYSHIFDINKIKSFVKIFNVGELRSNDTSNVLWRGILKDCAKKATFSCIQKNVYTYLDNTFTDRDNITVFDGFVMTRNNLDYHKYSEEYNEQNSAKDKNDIDDVHVDDEDSYTSSDEGRNIDDNNVEPLSPLEEVTTAVHDKAIKFLATRDYEVQLPNFFFEGTSIKLSPKEIDEDGALIRVDFKNRAVSTEGRFFKKIKKFIKTKLVTSLLALILIIKLIKIKFMFILPLLLGAATAKKLFLKLLLFLVPAFAHVFKLCGSYYGTKYHHHHHQIAHHHHHVPVPVPIPSYHHDHHHHESEEFEGYDYTQPHIQYRKDIEELKEWGIEPYEDPEVYAPGPYAYREPSPGPYGMPQYAANARPVTVVPNHLGPFEKYVPQIKYDRTPAAYENPNPNIRNTLNNIGVTQFNKNFGPKMTVANLGPVGNHAQSLAYNGYLDDVRFTRAATPVTEPTSGKAPYPSPQQQIFSTQVRPGTAFAKNSAFAVKSDNVDNWSSGQTGKSPVFVQNSATQGFGQPAKNGLQQTQSSNGQQVVQHALSLNPSSSLQKPSYSPLASSQNLNRNNNGPVTGMFDIVKQDLSKKQSPDVTNNQGRIYDDQFYGPILGRLDEIFRQLRFVDEDCRNRLVCSMYKNPTMYTPHSNLVSNELSREADELRKGNRESDSGRRFQRYLTAARAGQDGGDCSRLYSCHISTE